MHVLPASRLPQFAVYYPQLAAHVIAELGRRVERSHRRLDLITLHGAREPQEWSPMGSAARASEGSAG
jgi:hypothetical protein